MRQLSYWSLRKTETTIPKMKNMHYENAERGIIQMFQSICLPTNVYMTRDFLSLKKKYLYLNLCCIWELW